METLTDAMYWLEIVRIVTETDDGDYFVGVCHSPLLFHESQWFRALSFSVSADPYGLDIGSDLVQELTLNGYLGLLRSQLIAAMVKDCELIIENSLLKYGGLCLDDLNNLR